MMPPLNDKAGKWGGGGVGGGWTQLELTGVLYY